MAKILSSGFLFSMVKDPLSAAGVEVVMTIKKTLLTLAVLGAMQLNSTAFSAGIPTIDAAAIAQMVKQFMQMEKEFEQLLEQYKELQRQTEELTGVNDKLEGISGMADIFRNEESLELFPELVDIISLEDFGPSNMPSGAQDIYNKRGFDEACSGISGEMKTLCERSGAYLATNEYSYNAALQNTAKRIANLEQMIDKIGEAQTAKQIEDLQARIQAELGLIQVAQIKAQLSRDRMQSAMAGLQQQRNIKMKNYFYGN